MIARQFPTWTDGQIGNRPLPPNPLYPTNDLACLFSHPGNFAGGHVSPRARLRLAVPFEDSGCLAIYSDREPVQCFEVGVPPYGLDQFFTAEDLGSQQIPVSPNNPRPVLRPPKLRRVVGKSWFQQCRQGSVEFEGEDLPSHDSIGTDREAQHVVRESIRIGEHSLHPLSLCRALQQG